MVQCGKIHMEGFLMRIRTCFPRLAAAVIALSLMLFSSSAALYAHPGMTDAKGGHNKTSDGTYHYHLGSDRKTEYATPPNGEQTPEPDLEAELLDTLGLVNAAGQRITLGMKKVPIDIILRKPGAIVTDGEAGPYDLFTRYDYGGGLSITYRDGICCAIDYSAEKLPSGWAVIGGAGPGDGFDGILEIYDVPEDMAEAITGAGTALICHYPDENGVWVFSVFAESGDLPPDYDYMVSYAVSSAENTINAISVSEKPLDEFTVFWGHSGDKVHLNPNCITIRNGVFSGTLEEAVKAGHTEGWCQVCSKGWTDERFLESGNPNVR
jgi:hypothetical protein